MHARDSRQVLRAHANGDLSGYQRLAQEFSQRLSGVTEARMEELVGDHHFEGSDDALRVWQHSDGVYYAHHPSTGTVSLRAAIATGLIKQSSR